MRLINGLTLAAAMVAFVPGTAIACEWMKTTKTTTPTTTASTTAPDAAATPVPHIPTAIKLPTKVASADATQEGAVPAKAAE
ncbi:hypothetical protein H2509_07430 [Stappia sp. F7233]|uniref:Uncharacterized protein n=1 Tax=Stappia albiluteola TaxID=2758565 RepID=A0A839AC00_9HYPH|nr:hypothetical protein [Stappia albiluteola]MBA5776961.1 hypothetical protein [Stappia albiluteola]